jgi:hypothetical protein
VVWKAVGLAATVALAVVAGVQSRAAIASVTRTVPVRDCASSVYGDLGRNWRRRTGTIVVGPIAFPDLFAPSRTAPASLFAPVHGRYLAQKVLLVVKAKMTVRLVIPAREATHLRLLYDPAAWKRADRHGRYRLADGSTAAVFHACPNETQFNGGFLVVGRQCARVLVYVGRRTRPLTARLTFGRPCA